MPDLYLIRRSDEAVWVYRSIGEGKWRHARIAQCQTAKVKYVLWKGPKGWAVQDQSPGSLSGPSCLATPVEGQAEEGDGLPPLGLWRSPDGKTEYTLGLGVPDCGPLGDLTVEKPFITVTYSEQGNLGHMELKFTNKAITDEDLDSLIATMTERLVHMARRVDSTVLVVIDLQNAAVPAMRHVRRYMAWAKELGDLMDLFIRGCAIVLKPSGFVGSALVSVVRMMQRVLQAAWPEGIFPTTEEAQRFLAGLPSQPLAQLEGGGGAGAGEKALCPEEAPAAALGVDLPSTRSASTLLTEWGSLTRSASSPQVAPMPEPLEAAGKARQPAAEALKPRRRGGWRRPGARTRGGPLASPELMKLEVPVWVHMGYKPGRARAGSVDSKVGEPDALDDAREPVLCGCTCKRQARFSSQPRLLARFSL